MIQNSSYHRILRVSSVVLALVLLFESGLVVESTARLSQDTHRYLANAVGMYAAVQPTELNTLTAELTAQKQMLDAREAALREREINIDFGGGAVDRSTYIISGLLFIVLVLLVLNYTLDYLRLRELQALRAAKQTV